MFCRTRITVLLPAILLFASAISANVERARAAEEFVESIGVCTHWGYGDTPYGPRFPALRDSLLSCGIRHTRDGIDRAYGINGAVIATSGALTSKTPAAVVVDRRR